MSVCLSGGVEREIHAGASIRPGPISLTNADVLRHTAPDRLGVNRWSLIS